MIPNWSSLVLLSHRAANSYIVIFKKFKTITVYTLTPTVPCKDPPTPFPTDQDLSTCKRRRRQSSQAHSTESQREHNTYH